VRCSDCGRMVKPVVALDIDGTLARYHEALVEFIINYTDTEPGPAVPCPGRTAERIGGDFGDWVCFAFRLDRRTYRDIKLAFRQGGQKRFMPAYPYASELAYAAADESAEVWVTTSWSWMTFLRCTTRLLKPSGLRSRSSARTDGIEARRTAGRPWTIFWTQGLC
jgi:hypothetical protein